MSAIPDSEDGVVMKAVEKKVTSISEHLLNMNNQVRDAGHKTNRSEQYELAFFALLRTNEGSHGLMKKLSARREQFISDAVIAGYPAATHFLEHNKDYQHLFGLPRTQALQLYQKDNATTVQQYVTLVNPPSTGSRNNRRGGGGGGGGGGNSGGGGGGHQGGGGGGYGNNNRQNNAPNQYQQQQQQYNPPMQNQQQGPNNYSNSNSGRGRGPPGTPHTTRGGSQFNGSR
jgi:uncharacterized membrane protein YgcG